MHEWKNRKKRDEEKKINRERNDEKYFSIDHEGKKIIINNEIYALSLYHAVDRPNLPTDMKDREIWIKSNGWDNSQGNEFWPWLLLFIFSMNMPSKLTIDLINDFF